MKRDGLGADFVFRFWLQDGRQLVVVVGDDIQTYDGGVLTFIDTRLAVIDKRDFDSLYKVAADAGCPA